MEFCTVTREFVLALGKAMRSDDRAECYRMGYRTPVGALEASLEASEVSFGVHIDRAPAACCGLIPTEVDGALNAMTRGQCWILTGQVFDRHPREYLRTTLHVLERLLFHCPVLWSHLDARHPRAMRWAEWLKRKSGLLVTVSEAVPMGPYRLPFVELEIRR